MNFGDIDNIVLFGGGTNLVGLASWCNERDVPVVVFTSPRHADEAVSPDGTSLRDTLEAEGVSVFSSENINEEPELQEHVTANTLGIALGPAWIFRNVVLDLFDGRIVNFHNIPLPRVRGGAHYTWQILRGNRTGGCNIQLIERKLDAGAVIKTLEYQLPASARIPQDYFDASRANDMPFLFEFMEEVQAAKDFDAVGLQETLSTYFPRLSTPDQGLIDWSWSTEEIERFICAFDEPYPGASTFAGDRRVCLKDCGSSFDDGPFHPFQTGLVYRKSAERIFVATADGSIIIGRVLAEDGSDAMGRLRVGDRLHTPFVALERAFTYRTRYSSVGLAVEPERGSCGTES